MFPEEDRLPREGEAGSISTRNLHKKPQCKRSLKGFWMAWGRLVCTYLCASCDIRAPRYCSHKSPSSKAWTQEYKAEYDGGGVGAALRHTVLLQFACWEERSGLSMMGEEGILVVFVVAERIADYHHSQQTDPSSSSSWPHLQSLV